MSPDAANLHSSPAHRTQLLTLAPAKNPRRALHTARKRIGGMLPVETLCTTFADATGSGLLNVEGTEAGSLETARIIGWRLRGVNAPFTASGLTYTQSKWNRSQRGTV